MAVTIATYMGTPGRNSKSDFRLPLLFCRPEIKERESIVAGPAANCSFPSRARSQVSRKIEVCGRIPRQRRAIERTSMETGTVKFFNLQKGFGFISPDKGGNDVFVHISAVERAGLSTLSEGQKVTYEVGQDKRSGKPAVTTIRTT
jgi:cold shock protein